MALKLEDGKTYINGFGIKIKVARLPGTVAIFEQVSPNIDEVFQYTETGNANELSKSYDLVEEYNPLPATTQKALTTATQKVVDMFLGLAGRYLEMAEGRLWSKLDFSLDDEVYFSKVVARHFDWLPGDIDLPESQTDMRRFCLALTFAATLASEMDFDTIDVQWALSILDKQEYYFDGNIRRYPAEDEYNEAMEVLRNQLKSA